ncbi:RDD family protein [Streptomyces sp. NPDC004838]
MSAPTPPGDDGSPTPGYYPDPSIPGYVRYWNGAAWVPGTSRPAPKEDEGAAMTPGQASPSTAQSPAQRHTPSPAPPPAPTPARTPAQAQAPAQLEETGPVFLDEEPSDQPSRPEPASAWRADTARQTGFGGERDNRVAWGGGQDSRTPGTPGADPRVPPQGQGEGQSRTQGRPPEQGRAQEPATAADPTGGALPGVRSGGPDRESEAAASARQAAPQTQQPQQPGAAQPPRDSTVAIRALRARVAAEQAEEALSVRSMTPGAAQPPAPAPAPAQASAPAPAQAPAPTPSPAPLPARPQAPEPSQAARPDPVTHGPGGGSASWAQQVHRLAQPEGEQAVAPFKPPVDDPFLRAAQAQAAARPAPLGRRFAARLIDTAVLGALVGAIAVPVVSRAIAHVDDKIEAAKQSGETVTVWLVDGTTGVHLAIVVGALLVLGVLYEALPTAKWGRTLGKKLCGLRVVDIESYDTPSFGTALRRWLVYSVLGVIAVGVVNVLWCLFDRPWRQCWHDKAARTFVTGRRVS